MTAAALPPDVSASGAEIETLLTTLFEATDARDWDTVRSLFADSVRMDYSDLGAEPATQTPDEVVAGWRSMLPGFERTVHHVHNLAVWVVPETTEPGGPARASATYDAIATHVLGGRDWTVFAGYDSEFVREGGAWKIARTRLSLYDQAGDTDLPAFAAQRVADGDGYSADDLAGFESPHAETVSRMLTDLGRGDVDAYLSAFADDGAQVMPLAPEGFPERVDGLDALREQYGPVAGFHSQRYPHEVYTTADSDVVVARYRGEITVAPGSEYNNHYVGVFAFDEAGELATFTEYFNPEILANGFPGAPPAHYSVHASGASPTSGVALREVRFDSHGDELVGHLFLPPGFDEGRQYPAVVVTGSWTSVKEQMPDTYASRLAADGFVALTFDFRGFGESEGAPRQFEDDARKTEDVRAAVDFLAGHPNVSADIAGLGVCASAGYMARATVQDDRIRRLALVAPWLHTPEMTEALYASRPGGRGGLLALGREARTHYEATGEVRTDQAVSELNPMAAMYVPGGAFPYYLDPALGAGAHYANRWAVMSWEPWLTFDSHAAADEITVPVHVVHSEQGAVPDGARAFMDRLPNGAEAVWLDDYAQMELYQAPEAVTAAMDATSAWLQRRAAD
jgi:fermentation-respiration switch protein FrsA (DUF1100 family)/ketosteroid isomerase-like protein